MNSITTFIHFEVPSGDVDRYFAFWQDNVKDAVNCQPGLIDWILHRSIDPDGPFQFINVARWESAKELESGLRAAVEAPQRDGTEMGKVFHDLGVKVSQNDYVPAVRYSAHSDPVQAA